MPVGELHGVVQDQGKRFPVARKSLPCGTKAPSQDVRFADPLIGEEAICCLRVYPVLRCPRRCGSYPVGKLLQQLPQPLAMVNVPELTSHHFIVDPFSRPRLRKVPALHGPNTSRVAHALQSATTTVRIVSN